MAGVGFCILLVPINRWLAVKIGQLSTKMMAQKDQRVKVRTCAYTFIHTNSILKEPSHITAVYTCVWRDVVHFGQEGLLE